MYYEFYLFIVLHISHTEFNYTFSIVDKVSDELESDGSSLDKAKYQCHY